MFRRLALVGCLFALGACGSSSSSSSTSPTEAAAVTTEATATSAADATTAAPATDAATTAAAASSGDSSAFCAAAKAESEDLPKKFQELAGGGDPAGWVAYADAAEQANSELEKLVPSELKDSFGEISKASVTVIDAIRSSGGDFSKITAALGGLADITGSPEFTAASAKWSDYLKSECGIDPLAG